MSPDVRRKAARFVRAALLALACMAPSAGNIGSCGQEAQALDAEKFFAAKNSVDCASCLDCGLATVVCEQACNGVLPEDPSFPDPCLPLVHDGEVCLDALSAASCSEYASYVADVAATIPTECNFCPLDDEGKPVRD